MIENLPILLLTLSDIVSLQAWKKDKLYIGIILSVILAVIGFVYIDQFNEEIQTLAYTKLMIQGMILTLVMIGLALYISNGRWMLGLLPLVIYFMATLSIFTKIK